jgi:hypothetical protein
VCAESPVPWLRSFYGSIFTSAHAALSPPSHALR